MKRYVFIFGVILSLALFSAPYKPYPILMIHGYRAGSGSWGAPTKNRSDSIPAESLKAHPDGTYEHFLPLMTPYAWAWYNWEKDADRYPLTANRQRTPSLSPSRQGREERMKKG